LTKPGSHPAWSADGRKIAFFSGRARAHIYVVNSNGSDRRKLTGGKPSEFDPAWSPNGRMLVFARHSGGRDSELYTMRADGSALKRLTKNDAWDHSPSFSPNGRRIVCVRTSKTGQHEIFTMHADGSHARKLTESRRRVETSPDWSPNGKKIVFAAGPRSDTDEGSDIYKMKANGKKVRKVTDGADAIQPVWSPNGKKIAFSANGAVFVMRTNGEGIRRLTGSAAQPDWQPR
jgi:TolB protein